MSKIGEKKMKSRKVKIHQLTAMKKIKRYRTTLRRIQFPINLQRKFQSQNYFGFLKEIHACFRSSGHSSFQKYLTIQSSLGQLFIVLPSSSGLIMITFKKLKQCSTSKYSLFRFTLLKSLLELQALVSISKKKAI